MFDSKNKTLKNELLCMADSYDGQARHCRESAVQAREHAAREDEAAAQCEQRAREFRRLADFAQ